MTKDKRSSWIRGDALVGEGWLYLPQEVSCCWGCRGLVYVWVTKKQVGLVVNGCSYPPKNDLRLIGLGVFCWESLGIFLGKFWDS